MYIHTYTCMHIVYLYSPPATNATAPGQGSESESEAEDDRVCLLKLATVWKEAASF